MTINPVLAQVDVKQQSTAAPRQEEVGRWLRDSEINESNPKEEVREWLAGAVTFVRCWPSPSRC